MKYLSMSLSDMKLRLGLEFSEPNDTLRWICSMFFLSGEFPVTPEEQGLFWSPSLSFQQLSCLYYYQYIPNIPCYTQYSPHLFAHYLPVLSSFTFIHDLEKAFPSFFRQNTHRCPWELCPKVAVSASTLDINYMTVLLKYNYFIPVPNCKHVNFFFHL